MNGIQLLAVLVLIDTLVVCGYLGIYTPQMGMVRVLGLGALGFIAAAVLYMLPRITRVKTPAGELFAEQERQVNASVERVVALEATAGQHAAFIASTARDAGDAHEKIADLQTLLDAAEARAAALEATMTEAQDQLQVQQELTVFHERVLRANNDDRWAFEDLMEARTEGPFQVMAIAATNTIIADKHPFLDIRILPNVAWKRAGIDPNTTTLEGFRRLYPTTTYAAKEDFLVTVWDQARFSLYERLAFMFWILEKDDSLRGVQRALVLIDQEAKIERPFLDNREAFFRWWNAHKDAYRSTGGTEDSSEKSTTDQPSGNG